MPKHLLILVALLCALGATLPSVVSQARVVSTTRIERAWKKTCPHLNTALARSWAKVLQKEAKKRSFCPYTVIAIVKHETGGTCNPRLVYNNLPREYSVGLGQVNVIHHRDCKAGGIQSPGCQAYIGMLMDGGSNLRVVSSLITANRKFCRKKTGRSALFARWLSSYQGLNNSRGRKGVWCNMRQDKNGRWSDVKTPWSTKRVIDYRRYLVRTLG